MSSSCWSVPTQNTPTWQLTVAAHATPAATTSKAPMSVLATMILFIAQPHFFGTPHWSTCYHGSKTLRVKYPSNGLFFEKILLERVMNLGKNRIEMRIPQSAWFPRDLRFPHS